MSGYMFFLQPFRGIFGPGGGPSPVNDFRTDWMPYDGETGPLVKVAGDPDTPRETFWNRWYLRWRGFRKAAMFCVIDGTAIEAHFVGRRVNGRTEVCKYEMKHWRFLAAVRREDVEYFVIKSWGMPCPIALEKISPYSGADGQGVYTF